MSAMWSTMRRLISSGTRSVEAAVAGLHVEDRDLAALGGDRRQAAVGVAEDQHRVGLLSPGPVGRGDDLADRLGGVSPGGAEEVVGRRMPSSSKKTSLSS
jgi:hypothetical protein